MILYEIRHHILDIMYKLNPIFNKLANDNSFLRRNKLIPYVE